MFNKLKKSDSSASDANKEGTVAGGGQQLFKKFGKRLASPAKQQQKEVDQQKAKPVKILPAGCTIPRAPLRVDESQVQQTNNDVTTTDEEEIRDIIQKFHASTSLTGSSLPSNKKSSSKGLFEKIPHSYCNVDASKFDLRTGPNYKKKKQKAPSEPALYDLYKFDICKRANSTLKNASDQFEIPSVPDLETGHPSVPPMFIVVCNTPLEEPSMMSKEIDGPSYVSVLYFIISDHFRKQLSLLKEQNQENEEETQVKVKPSTKLFVEWCERAENDDAFRGRFKTMAILDNIESLGLPQFISSYNGKPALITKSGRFKRHHHPSSTNDGALHYIEMNINVFLFTFVAKKCLYSLYPKFPNFLLNMGFTIEGRDDEELPECLLGGCRIMNLDLSKVNDLNEDDV